MGRPKGPETKQFIARLPTRLHLHIHNQALRRGVSMNKHVCDLLSARAFGGDDVAVAVLQVDLAVAVLQVLRGSK